MFLGSYKTSFDIKSRRVALPKKIREHLKTNEIILSLGFEKCIFGFDTGSWQKESAKQLEQPISTRSARDIRRFFFSDAVIVQLDDQGRFVIPASLLDYAEVKSLLVIGAGDHFEIWDEDNWKDIKQKLEAELAK